MNLCLSAWKLLGFLKNGAPGGPAGKDSLRFGVYLGLNFCTTTDVDFTEEKCDSMVSERSVLNVEAHLLVLFQQ